MASNALEIIGPVPDCPKCRKPINRVPFAITIKAGELTPYHSACVPLGQAALNGN